MPRLLRPYIPIPVRIDVAERQAVLGAPTVSFHDVPAKPTDRRLDALLGKIASQAGCEPQDLRLDHDPPLGARRKRFNRAGEHVDYYPAANDPAHLFYRPHGPQFAGSHLIKTNVRGDRGQFPDRVLIKRARRHERGESPKKASRFKCGGHSGRKPKAKAWPTRPLRSANRWPSKESKKLETRRRR
jgi:hypothetical protein